MTLVPHFSGTLETFQVTYVEGDQEGPEDNNSYQSGSYATVLGPKNGNLRFLFWKDTATDKIYKPGESMKMSGDVTLIAVYTEAPATVGLTYHNGTDSRTETGIRSNTFATVKSAANLGFTAPTGYVFVGWSTTEGGAATYFPGNAVYVPEKGAHLYAVWTERTDLSYTVRYLDEDTGANVKDPITYNGQTFDSKISVAAHMEEIPGYTFAYALPAEELTIGTDSNVITLYYTRNSFKVTYEYTGTVPKNAPALPKDATESVDSQVKAANAPELAGYVFSGWTAEDVTIDANGFFTMPNHDVTFTGSWTKRADLSYTVEYREGSKTGTELKEAKTESGKTFGETYTENAEVIDGYTVDAETKNVTVGTGENKIIFIYTKRTDLSYTVKYLWTDGMGSGTAIEGVRDKVVKNVTFGDVIVEGPIDITGYTPVETGKVERRMDEESLTIVFLYYKNVTLTAASGSVVYNGSTQTLSGYTSSEAEAVFESVTASGSGEDVGEYAVTFSGVSEREQKISKDGRYLLTGTEDGKLTITPATLTVTTDSDSKVYDGNALTAPGSITGLVGDDTATFTVTGSQTDVGSSDNTYSIDWGNTKSSNYTVVETLGTLNVTAQNITPPENPDDPNGYLGVQVDSPTDHVYDGAEHKWAPL